MAQLEIEKYRSTEYWNAIYVDKNGSEFYVVFTLDYDYNSQYGQRELINIEKDETTVPKDHPVWETVGELVKDLALEEKPNYKEIEFRFRIDKNWLETLEYLTQQIIDGGTASPEEALELMIFQQIKL